MPDSLDAQTEVGCKNPPQVQLHVVVVGDVENHD